MHFLNRENVDQLVGARAEAELFAVDGDQVGVFVGPVQPAEGMALAGVHLKDAGQVLLDQRRLGDHVQRGRFQGDDVVRAKDAGVGQDGHAGKAKAVANRRHVRRQGQVRGLLRRKRRERDRGADGAGFLEGMEVDRVNLEAAGRGHLEAAPALVAVFEVHVNVTGVMAVLDQGAERAGVQDGLVHGGVKELFGEPVLVVVHHVMHGAARYAGQAAQGKVLHGAAKAAARVALDVGEVDQEAGVFDHAGDVPLLDRLDRGVRCACTGSGR